MLRRCLSLLVLPWLWLLWTAAMLRPAFRFPLGAARGRGEEKQKNAKHRRTQKELQPNKGDQSDTPLHFFSPANRNASLPVTSVLRHVGHQYFSTCSTTSCVPAKWLTPGGRSGLYIVSVRSRISATFLPSFTNCRIANGRPSTHMFRCTPQISTLSIFRAASRFHTSCPLSLMASPGRILMPAACRFHGERISHLFAQSQPMSESSIGNTPSRLPSGQFHAVPHRSVFASATGVFANGAS